MEINFINIRPHNGSKSGGFEELVCQLAHLQKPNKAKNFIRKEGSGGDAGIECYWALEDNSEIAWQAKYFTQRMSSSQWSQVDESFKVAFKNHPNLKKYVVSIPLDRTDRKKSGGGDKKALSSDQDKWNRLTQTWKVLAEENNRDIEFEFWGKHELTLFLIAGGPFYPGLMLYWFNELVLGFNTFNSVAKRSQESLGERYTQEFHVDLPISGSFDALSSNAKWWKRLKGEKKELVQQGNNFFSELPKKDNKIFDKRLVKRLKEDSSELINLLSQCIKCKNLIDLLDEAKGLCEKIQSHQENLIERGMEDLFYKDKFRKLYLVCNNFFNGYLEFSNFLNSKLVKAAKVGAVLLYGEAGIGKSHLLCDMSLRRIEEQLPTVFMLGQHYDGGDPIETLKSVLDLSKFSHTEVLGALDTAGAVHSAKTLIVIDAINEGAHRDEWCDHIRNFLTKVSEYKNISILLSCRTTYLKYILPNSVDDDCLIQVQHTGFQGYEHRAAELYMSKQGISKPSAPILTPEFTNPLFLKACCQALKNSGQKSFPKGMQGLSSLFDFYLQSVEKPIADLKKYSSNEEIIRNALICFSSKIFPDNFYGLQAQEARNLINNFDPSPNDGHSLFNELIQAGVLLKDIHNNEQGKNHPVIRFTYERFSDYFISLQIVNQYDKKTIRDIFSKGSLLRKAIEDENYFLLDGILDSLSIILAEKFGVELTDLLPKEFDNQIKIQILEKVFPESVLWRSANSFTDRTLELLNSLTGREYSPSSLDILLKLSTEPDHPWNADLIHENLVDKSMAERDHFWSIYIALGDQIEANGEAESIVRTLIEWSCYGEINEIEAERARLCATTLFWFLTTSNRRVRDQSTKISCQAIIYSPHVITRTAQQVCPCK